MPELYTMFPIEVRTEKPLLKTDQPDAEMLKGTLDMMVLRTLVCGDAHGHTIAKIIERTSEDVLEVERGSPLDLLVFELVVETATIYS
jgi:hypothetical protein